MAILSNVNDIKSKINSIIGNNEEDDKDKIKNQINSIINSKPSTSLSEQAETKKQTNNRIASVLDIKKQQIGKTDRASIENKLKENASKQSTRQEEKKSTSKGVEAKPMPTVIEQKNTSKINTPISNTPITNIDTSKAKVVDDNELAKRTNYQIDRRSQAQKLLESATAVPENLITSTAKAGNQIVNYANATVNQIRKTNKAINTATSLMKVLTGVDTSIGKASEALDKVLDYSGVIGVQNDIQNWVDSNNQYLNEKTYETTQRAKAGSKVLGKAAELSSSLGGTIIGLAGTAVNPVLGTVLFMTSAGGDYLDDARERGMNEAQAYAYATIMGGMEGATEAYITKGRLKNIKSLSTAQLNKLLNSWGVDMAENALQEAAIEPISEVTAYLVSGRDRSKVNLDPNKSEWDRVKELAERTIQSGIDGALSEILFMGMESTIGTGANIKQKAKSAAQRVYNKLQNKISPTSSDLTQMVNEAKANGIDVNGIMQRHLEGITNAVTNSMISNDNYGKYYIAEYNGDQLVGTQEVIGTPIKLVDERLNASPVLVYTNEGSTIIDADTGTKLTNNYTTPIKAIKYTNEMLSNISDEGIETINKRLNNIKNNLDNITAQAEVASEINKSTEDSEFYNKNSNYEVQDIDKTTSVFKNNKAYTFEEIGDIEDNIYDTNIFDLYSIDNKNGDRVGYLWITDNGDNLEVHKVSDATEDTIEKIIIQPNKDNKFSGSEINNAIRELVINNENAAIEGQTDIEGNIVSNKPKKVANEKGIQGLEGYSRAEVKNIAKNYIQDKLSEEGIDLNINDLEIIGSRNRGDARADSDLDVVVEYSGDMREDDLFNLLNESPLEIEGIKVDINPITADKTGTLKEYLAKSKEYDKMKQKEGGNKDERRREDSNVGQEASGKRKGDDTKGEGRNEESNGLVKNQQPKGLQNYQKQQQERLGKDFKAEIVNEQEITPREKNVKDAFFEITGVILNFYKTNIDTTESAFYNSSEIYKKHGLAMPKKVLNHAVWHEYGHWLKDNNRQQWDKLHKIINKTITTKQIKDYINVLNDKDYYKKMSKSQKRESIIDEIISDYIGNWANNIKNWENLLPYLSEEYQQVLADIAKENTVVGYNVFGTIAQQEQINNEIKNIMYDMLKDNVLPFSNRNDIDNNMTLKNSKQSSFIMPKNVKDIKNLNEFLRKTIPNETNKYWKEQLKEAQAANYTDWTRRESRLQWKRKTVQQYLDYKNNIEYSDRNDVDNEGRELSKEQQEFFKNSKVRDAEGNLKVMYHGTEANVGIPNEFKFTIFDEDRQGSHGSWFGNGFYFTSSKAHAQDYAHSKGDVYEVYLNITNPYIPSYDVNTSFYEEYLEKFEKILEEHFSDEPPIRPETVKKVLQASGYDGIIIGDTAIAFYSNQIKNIDNTNPTDSKDIRYSNRYDTDENNNYGFYSQLEKAIEDKMPNAANVQQIRGILNGSGIKQDEMNWIGLDDYLKAHSLEKISKQDILDYIKANQINIETVEKGYSRIKELSEPIKEDIKDHIQAIKKIHNKYHMDYEISDDDIYYYKPNGLTAGTIGDYMADTLKGFVNLDDTDLFEKQEDGSYISSYTNDGVQWQSGITEEILESDMQELEDLYEGLHEAQTNLDMLNDEYMDEEDKQYFETPKYERYKLEGGTNYQEKLYTVPALKKDERGRYEVKNLPVAKYSEYKSPHWSEKNVVAHVRTQDFQDINGNIVLFIDEIQSDMHQEGREKGYRTQEQNNRIKSLEKQIADLQRKHNDIEEEYYGVYHDIRDRMIKKMDDIHDKILRNDAIFREIESILTREEQQAYTTYILDISYLIESQYSKNDFDLTDRKRLEKDIKNIMDSQATFPNISEDIINKFSSKEEFYKYTYDFIQSSLINDIKEDYKVGVHALTESELNKFATEKERQVIKDRRTIREDFNKNIDNLNNQLNELKYGENAGRIADIFPFKKNWHEFVLRRMINDAVQNGYDEVAWTTGKQQRERYNLAKYIDYIEYQKLYNHPNDVDAGNVGEVEIQAYKEGQKVFDRQIPAKDLADYIGKDLATQILTSKEGKGEISNLDESINENGKSGMYLFYDQEIPAYLNKYLKKWNSKVETITLKDADGKKESKQPGFKITEEMKQAVKEIGQPLYADRIDLEDDSMENYTEEQKQLLEEQRKERLEVANMIKQRSFYKNIYGSDIPKEMRKEMKKNKDMYNYSPISNQATLEKAQKAIDNTKNIRDVFLNNELKTAEDTAIGELLIRSAITKGNYADANSLTASLAEKLTNAGQIIQAASIFKRMTPEGMLLFAEQQINKINKELNQKFMIDKFLNKKEVKVQLTDEKVAFINEMMQEMQKWEEKKAEVKDAVNMEIIERQEDIILAKIMAKIGEDIPPTKLEKLAAWRNISLLLNPKTIMRNLVSNTFFGTLENLTDTLGVGLDMAISLATGERSLLMPNLKTQAKGLKKGLNYAIEDTKNEISTSLGGNKYEITPGKVFKNNLLNKLQTASYFGVEGLDRPFMQAKYESALEMLMKLEGLKYGKDLATEDMKQEALEIAKYTTFKEKNAVSDFLSKTKRTLNQGRSIGAADVIGLTYTNIPGNLTKKAIDYSPAGLYNVFKAYNNFKNKKLGGESTRQAQRQLVQATSRVLIGTGIMTASMAAFLKGIITASGDDEDEKVKALTNQENYAINVSAFLRWLTGGDTTKKNGDLYVTYSNYEPLSSMIAAAADMMASAKEGEDPATIAYKGLTTWINTIAELSTLSNFSSLFEYGDLGGTLTRSLAQFPSSFIPTFSKQIAQFIETNSKSNYSDNYMVKNFINPMLQRIPGLSSTLENYYDTFGEAEKNFNGSTGLARIYDVFLNTSFTSTTDMDETKQELYDLYLSTGSTNHLPIQVKNYFTYKGEKITLTAKEKAEYQKQLGQRTAEAFKNLINTSEYQKLSDEAKVKKLSSLKDDIIEETKGDVVLEPRGLAYETKFSPSKSYLQENKQQLVLTKDMQLEYEKIAVEEYNRLKKQGLYTEDKMVSTAKANAKKYMMDKYKSQLVKAGE